MHSENPFQPPCVQRPSISNRVEMGWVHSLVVHGLTFQVVFWACMLVVALYFAGVAQIQQYFFSSLMIWRMVVIGCCLWIPHAVAQAIYGGGKSPVLSGLVGAIACSLAYPARQLMSSYLPDAMSSVVSSMPAYAWMGVWSIVSLLPIFLLNKWLRWRDD